MKKLILFLSFILLSFYSFSQNVYLVERNNLYEYTHDLIKHHYNRKYIPFNKIFNNLNSIRKFNYEYLENIYDKYHEQIKKDISSMKITVSEDISHCVAKILYNEEILESFIDYSYFKYYTILIYTDNINFYLVVISF